MQHTMRCTMQCTMQCTMRCTMRCTMQHTVRCLRVVATRVERAHPVSGRARALGGGPP